MRKSKGIINGAEVARRLGYSTVYVHQIFADKRKAKKARARIMNLVAEELNNLHNKFSMPK